MWSAQTDLYFLEVCSSNDADIVFLWGVFNHGDAAPFDGEGGVLAHTLGGPPPNVFGDQAGDIHFDDSETWTLGNRPNDEQPIDLLTVAAHEIRHALGLDHTTVPGSLMLAIYTGSHRFLGADDIAGIQSLYGSPQNNIPITGSQLVCTNASFSLQDQPTGTTLNWSSSNTNGLTINPTTGEATRQNNFNGQVTITVTINSGCGQVNIARTVTVGTPTPIGINGPNYDLCRERGHPYGSGTFSVVNPLPSITYQWQVVKSNGQIESQGSGLSVTLEGFRYAVGYHTIRVRSSSCSTFSPWYSSTFGVVNCGSSFYSSEALYPNPAFDEVTVVLGQQQDSLSEIYSLKLVNIDQEIVFEKSTKSCTIVIPVSNLPEGTYYLNISSKEGIIQRRVLVKR